MGVERTFVGETGQWLPFQRLAWVTALACSLLTPGSMAGRSSEDATSGSASGGPASAESRDQGPCSAPEHRQLDFWLGDWQVYRPDGELAGRNEISLVASGCALLESWHGELGGRGTSLTYYDPGTERWRQNWVGMGTLLDLKGGWDGERMLLQGDERSAPEGPVTDRIAWTPLDSGEVLQVWEVSRDGGKSWERGFAGTYRPSARALAEEVP